MNKSRKQKSTEKSVLLFFDNYFYSEQMAVFS